MPDTVGAKEELAGVIVETFRQFHSEIATKKDVEHLSKDMERLSKDNERLSKDIERLGERLSQRIDDQNKVFRSEIEGLKGTLTMRMAALLGGGAALLILADFTGRFFGS